MFLLLAVHFLKKISSDYFCLNSFKIFRDFHFFDQMILDRYMNVDFVTRSFNFFAAVEVTRDFCHIEIKLILGSSNIFDANL